MACIDGSEDSIDIETARGVERFLEEKSGEEGNRKKKKHAGGYA